MEVQIDLGLVLETAILGALGGVLGGGAGGAALFSLGNLAQKVARHNLEVRRKAPRAAWDSIEKTWGTKWTDWGHPYYVCDTIFGFGLEGT
jgi:hypothetical protein